ncbi:MAG: dTMP kinase [Betaproteobacteria bacterium]
MMPGKFITFEGIDGAGKTTHLAWLADLLRERGIAITVTREPGGTPFGERLRELLLDGTQRLTPVAEMLLMFAARREHLSSVIVPALKDGRWVLCDRFTDATFAYQGGGSGVPWADITALERIVHGELQPHITVLFDVPPGVGRQRSARARAPDRFEQEQEAFHARVRDAYLQRAREHPARIRVIDASSSVDEVQKELQNIVL